MEVVTRNIAAGSLAKKMGVEEGYVMKRPLVEFYYKNDDLGDPMINADYAEAFWLGNRGAGCRNQSLRPEDQRNLKSLSG